VSGRLQTEWKCTGQYNGGPGGPGDADRYAASDPRHAAAAIRFGADPATAPERTDWCCGRTYHSSDDPASGAVRFGRDTAPAAPSELSP